MNHPIIVLNTFRLVAAVIFLGAITGCASGPIKLEEPLPTLSVSQVSNAITENAELDWDLSGEQVLWGGTVLSVTNLADTTQIEMMSHPLDRRQRPMTGRAAQGRFVAFFEGFIEPLNFPAGRAVTIFGALIEPVSGTVGAASYHYPALQVIDSHLWTPQELNERTGVTFGIGINLGN